MSTTRETELAQVFGVKELHYGAGDLSETGNVQVVSEVDLWAELGVAPDLISDLCRFGSRSAIRIVMKQS